MRFGTVALDEAEGAILAHAVRGPGIAFKKGRVLSVVDVTTLRAAGFGEVIAAGSIPTMSPRTRRRGGSHRPCAVRR